MRVYVANFGRKNYEWPECLKRGTIAVMNAPAHHALWKARDLDGFIAAGLEHRTYEGKKPDAATVKRWYTAADIFAQSAGDIWIHRADETIWWTTSRGIMADEFSKVEPKPSGRDTIVNHYGCQPWSNANRRGRNLSGDHLHPRDHNIFSTPQTVVEVRGDNRAYALALIAGDDLSRWRNDPVWADKQTHKSRRDARKRETSDAALERSVRHMVETAYRTEANSFGQLVSRRIKKKAVGFPDEAAFHGYVRDLYDQQKGLCNLTGMPLQLHGQETDPAMLCSLDRIDSDGNYQTGNLQVVCRFANFWKQATENNDFVRLIDMLRKSSVHQTQE